MIGSLVTRAPVFIYFTKLKDTSGHRGELARVQAGEDMIAYMIWKEHPKPGNGWGGAQSPYFHPGNRENDLCSLSLTQAVIELPALGPASIPLPWPHCTLRATFPFSSQLPERPILHFSSHSKFSHGCMGALAHASCLMVGSSNLAHTNDEF